MNIESVKSIPDLKIVQPKVFYDDRGYFFESYNTMQYSDLGINVNFVQDNESMSQVGSLRGLHYQTGKYAQAKLVRVIKGRVWDVAVDVRQSSKTFGQWFGLELSEENKLQLFIPKGFAHGFVALENDTIFSYKCDQFYNKESEAGIIFNDVDLSIDWPLPEADLIISEKDKILPTFQNAITFP